MNLLVINWNDLKNPCGGGAEVHLEELLRRLVRRGHQVTLLCSGWPGCVREEINEGVRLIRRGNRYNFNLVGVMMEHCSAFFYIFVAQCMAYGLGKAICHAVWMANPFSFYYLNFLFLNRSLCEFFNADISRH